MKQNKKANTIDLVQLARALWYRAWLIVIAALLFGSIAYIGTRLLITPTYQASFTAYVNNSNDQGNKTTLENSDVTAARSLVSTYSAILTSPPVLENAAAEAGIDCTYEQLVDMVSTSIVGDTEIIQVNVTMDDPAVAVAVATAMANNAPEYVARIVEGSSMQVIAEPKLPTSIYGPSYIGNMAKGFLLGAILAAAVIVLLELIDDRVKSEEDLERRYGIAVMGTIPDLAAARKYGTYGKKAD